MGRKAPLSILNACDRPPVDKLRSIAEVNFATI